MSNGTLYVHTMCFYCYRCFSRDWRVLDYGMCDLMDLLAEIPDTTITITHQDLDTVISVPKRGEMRSHCMGLRVATFR